MATARFKYRITNETMSREEIMDIPSHLTLYQALQFIFSGRLSNERWNGKELEVSLVSEKDCEIDERTEKLSVIVVCDRKDGKGNIKTYTDLIELQRLPKGNIPKTKYYNP